MAAATLTKKQMRENVVMINRSREATPIGKFIMENASRVEQVAAEMYAYLKPRGTCIGVSPITMEACLMLALDACTTFVGVPGHSDARWPNRMAPAVQWELLDRALHKSCASAACK